MSINILAWNCRGAAAKSLPGRIRDVLKGNNVNILILCETRISGRKADNVLKKLNFNSWIRVEATGYAGGIWLLWNCEEVSVNYLSSSNQVLHAQVRLADNPRMFCLSCVYAEPQPLLRNELWVNLSQMSSRLTIPWVVMGDFNAYLSCEDKKGGGQPNYHSMRAFASCINNSGLITSEVVGDYFTWERDLLKERIDCAFYNQAWSNSFPLSKVHHLNKFGFDHRPILLRTVPRDPNISVPPPFRCRAAWFLENDFLNIVQRCWQGGAWNEKIKWFTKEAAQWSKSEICNRTTRKMPSFAKSKGLQEREGGVIISILPKLKTNYGNSTINSLRKRNLIGTKSRDANG